MLGASNLTRGLHAVVGAARDEHGPEVEIVAALGHGRSYGDESQFLARTLPGILQSELWPALDALPPAPTLAVVSDVGNDILYEFSPAQILEWVHDAVDCLQRHTPHIVLAGLPPVAEQQISEAKFTLLRSVLFPRCRLSLAEVSAAAATVEDGLRRLAASHGFRFVEMKREWYWCRSDSHPAVAVAAGVARDSDRPGRAGKPPAVAHRGGPALLHAPGAAADVRRRAGHTAARTTAAARW